MYEDLIPQLRVLIPDIDQVFGDDKDEFLWSDDDLTNFLEVAQGNVFHAAGFAMIAVGNSEALISKVIVSLDLSTDGSKVQAQWILAGKAMLARGDAIAAQANSFETFQIIPFRPYPHRAELTEGEWPYGY